jgi:hypothetical protein
LSDVDGTRERPTEPRRTPYELVFGEGDFESVRFPAVLREARDVGVDSTRRERFGFLSSAAELVRALSAEDAPAEAIDQYRAILFHAFNFWRFERSTYLLEPAVARFLAESAPSLRGWELRLPAPSLYLQLPANLFWASVAPEAVPEPVDGFFVTAGRAPDPLGPDYTHLDVLMVLGVRRDRDGFSVVAFDTPVGSGIAQVWSGAAARERGRDFTSVLPGGEEAALYSITTSAEALKLVARALWYVDAHPGAIEVETQVERRAEDRPGTPPRSRLEVRRVSLVSDPP